MQMNNFKENLNLNGNIYLARKREKEYIQKENKFNYDNYTNAINMETMAQI